MKTKLSVVCYIVAGMLLAVAVYTTVTNVLYLKSYAEIYGTSLATMWQDVVSYIISGFVPYFAYAFIIFVLGRVVRKVFEDSSKTLSCTEADAIEDEKQ